MAKLQWCRVPIPKGDKRQGYQEGRQYGQIDRLEYGKGQRRPCLKRSAGEGELLNAPIGSLVEWHDKEKLFDKNITIL
jgi:hypothetical protein